jgi:hypothetical protein
VELHVVRHELVDVAVAGGAPHRLDLALEGAHVAVEPQGRGARRDLLEARAHGVDLAELLGADRAHAHADERLGHDEAQRLELAQGLAHRALAHAELARHAGLDDALARRVGAVEDPLEERLLDLLAVHRPRQALLGHSSRSLPRDGAPRLDGRVANHK